MNKLGIKIMADSASEISAENAAKYDIDIIPMIVTEGEVEYLDGINFSADDLLQGLVAGRKFKTAQIPLNTYLERFKGYAQEGRKLVCFVLSSGLTGSYETALIARSMIVEEYPGADITVIDSNCAAHGYGLVVLEAARYLADFAETKEDFLEYVEYLKKHAVHLFTVEDIEYLYRGGRISRTQAVIGGLLNIKPILDVSPKGTLRPIGKARGTKNLIKSLIEEAKKRKGSTDLSSQTVCISSGLDTEIQENIKAFFEKECGVKEFIIQKIGPTIGAHTGPYMCAFYFFDAELKR
ncbi:MAG: DegV family protein [Bacillota bacterium]|nr:DegV family protein [Bacillota bacterium]